MKFYKIINLIAFFVMAGCTPKVAEWTAAESPKKNKVERIVFAHTVCYPAHATALECQEKKKLQKFLKENVPSPSAVAVTLSQCGGVSEKRILDVKRELLRHGVPDDLISTDDLDTGCRPASDKTARSGIEILIERYVVIPPSCSDFSQNIGDARQSAHSSNFGCAVEADLGMMVANPRDLLRGRERDPYVGIVLANGVRRYRDGVITPLLQSSTTTTTTATGVTPTTPATSTTVTSGGY